MKNIICMVLVFGAMILCGGLPAYASDEGMRDGHAGINALPTPPAGHSVRYVLPFFRSRTGGPYVTTMIRVYNHSNNECEVGVQFRRGLTDADACSITYPIGAQNSRSFCSRPVDEPTLTCSVSCPGAGLTFDNGHAYISSPAGCTNLAVDGQMVYTTDATDDVVSGATSLRIIKYGSPSKGD